MDRPGIKCPNDYGGDNGDVGALHNERDAGLKWRDFTIRRS